MEKVFFCIFNEKLTNKQQSSDKNKQLGFNYECLMLFMQFYLGVQTVFEVREQQTIDYVCLLMELFEVAKLEALMDLGIWEE